MADTGIPNAAIILVEASFTDCLAKVSFCILEGHAVEDAEGQAARDGMKTAAGLRSRVWL